MLTSAYLINRTPSALLKNKAPFEVLFGHAPAYKHLRVLGCLAYAHNVDHKGDNFAACSRRCVFLGYTYGKKGLKLYDLDRHVIFVSRDVVFQETTFPFEGSGLSVKSEGNMVVAPPGVSRDGDDEDDEQPPQTNADISHAPTTAFENQREVDTSQSQSIAATEVPVASTSEPQGRGHRQKYPST